MVDIGAGGVVPNFFEWQGDIAEPTFAARGSNRIKVIEKGVTGAIRLRPTDVLSIIGGVRLSWYDLDATTYTIATATTEVGDRLSARGRATPYAGIVYDVLPNLSVYGSYTGIFSPQTTTS